MIDDRGTELISVIIPVYKAENDLPRCLESLITQSYPQLQIILVDDGSPDRSGLICDEYAQKDGRIEVIHVPNRGAYAARNLALSHVCGKYVAFVDADDWVDPRMFETLLNLLLEFDADIAQCELKNEGEYVQIRSKEYGKLVVFSREELVGAFFDEGIAHGLLGKLFRREIWKERRFDENYYHVDAMTMATVQEFCSCFVRTDAPLYHYNTTGPGITRGTRNPLHIKSKERLFEVFSKAAEGAPVAGSFFICREIPSTGRLICPGGQITLKMAASHVYRIHKIFVRHWALAKRTEEFRSSGFAKKVFWNLFRYMPFLASVLVMVRARTLYRVR